MWTLAIDFGTSNTAGAMFVDGTVTSLEIGLERRLPSVVLLDESGGLVVGQEAVNQAVLHPDRVERAPKRRLGKGSTILLGGEAVPVAKAVGALMKPFLDEGLRRRNNEPPTKVVLTHPARWSDERLNALRAAAAGIGIAEPVFCPEPVAAAVHYADERLVDGHYVAVYDLGGGTFDTAVLRRMGEGFEVVGLPGGDERIGGEDFDHRLYQHFGQLLAREDRQLWDQLTTSDDRKFRRANADLLAQTRQAKEALSRNPTARVFLQIADRDLLVTREEFESLISDDVDRTVDEMARTIQIAGLPPEHVARLYLAGGASRIPLVQQRMAERFGDRVVTWDDPKCVVAMGAAKLLAQQVSHAPGAVGTGGPAAGGAPPAPSAPATPPPPVGVGAPPPPAGPGFGGAPPAPTAPFGPSPAPAGSPMGATVGAPPYTPTGPSPTHRPTGPSTAPYGTPMSSSSAGASGSKNQVTLGWVMAVLGLFTCGLASAAGIYFGNEAKKQGDPQGQTVMIVNIVMLVIGLTCGGVFSLALLSTPTTGSGF